MPTLTKTQVKEKLKGHREYSRVLHNKAADTAAKLQDQQNEIDWCEQMLKELEASALGLQSTEEAEVPASI